MTDLCLLVCACFFLILAGNAWAYGRVENAWGRLNYVNAEHGLLNYANAEYGLLNYVNAEYGQL